MRRRKGYADGPDGQIHYLICGEGPPVVLSHQSPSSLHQFDAVLEPLATAGFQAIAVDTPGFGQSDVPSSPPSIADYAAALVAVLDALGIAAAHGVGHHTGAMVINEAAVQYPDRWRKIVLNGPVPFTKQESDGWRDYALTFERAWRPKPDGSHLMEIWDRRTNGTKGWTSLEGMHRSVVDWIAAGTTGWYGHNAAFDYDQAAALMKITRPCLILTNTGDGVYDLALRARDMRPDFAFAALEGGTHDIIDEQPEAWTETVVSFLRDAA